MLKLLVGRDISPHNMRIWEYESYSLKSAKLLVLNAAQGDMGADVLMTVSGGLDLSARILLCQKKQ